MFSQCGTAACESMSDYVTMSLGVYVYVCVREQARNCVDYTDSCARRSQTHNRLSILRINSFCYTVATHVRLLILPLRSGDIGAHFGGTSSSGSSRGDDVANNERSPIRSDTIVVKRYC